MLAGISVIVSFLPWVLKNFLLIHILQLGSCNHFGIYNNNKNGKLQWMNFLFETSLVGSLILDPQNFTFNRQPTLAARARAMITPLPTIRAPPQIQTAV